MCYMNVYNNRKVYLNAYVFQTSPYLYMYNFTIIARNDSISKRTKKFRESTTRLDRHKFSTLRVDHIYDGSVM